MSERDKFLTEAMGECWHDWIQKTRLGSGRCICQVEGHYMAYENFVFHAEMNLDFSTPEGFFKLWNWAKEQEWWTIFRKSQIHRKIVKHDRGEKDIWGLIPAELINPDTFANAIYNYLKEVKNVQD